MKHEYVDKSFPNLSIQILDIVMREMVAEVWKDYVCELFYVVAEDPKVEIAKMSEGIMGADNVREFRIFGTKQINKVLCDI